MGSVLTRFIKQVDFIKNVDLSTLPLTIVNDPTPRYRMGQAMGVLIGVLIGSVLYFPANKPLIAIAPLFIVGWSLVFGEIQVHVFAPKRKVTYTIGSNKVVCMRPKSVGPQGSWSEPLENYVGIEQRQDFHGGGGVPGTTKYYVVKLKHKTDDERSVIINKVFNEETSLENHRIALNTFGLSAVS